MTMRVLLRRIRIAFYTAGALVLLDIGAPMLWTLFLAVYAGVIAYRAGDAWLCERERSVSAP